MSIRYRMPAEWEPHEGTWIAWPHEKTDWPGKFGPVGWVYCEIVRKLAQVERVHILIRNAAAERAARRMLKQSHVAMGAVEFVHIATDRSWTRDYCPIFVRNVEGSPLVLDWRFNGWAKYENWQVDDAVPAQIAERLGMSSRQPVLGDRRVVLEGGSIDVNGAGSMLTTEECLLSDVQARNPGLSRQDLEAIFREYLGVTNTLWLRNGIAGDDTHGHVDDLARFVSANTVVVATEWDRTEANYEPLKENVALLRRMKDQEGQPLRVVPLPMPRPVYFDGQRLPASYANFYIANKLVLVPTFNDPADREALATLAEVFPDREVTGIHSVDLVLGLGTLHCLTQQQIA
ncbi:MAG TPA: agmatine deiminase family protein [Bryobacteraceae bacterium]|nr:agmatine deiminase family protein [Bryobacteraceae bacterium]